MMATEQLVTSRELTRGETGRDPGHPFLLTIDEEEPRAHTLGTSRVLFHVLPETRGARTGPMEQQLVARPPVAAPAAPVRVLQAWEGRVLQCEMEQFTAILQDQGDRSRPDEQVTIAVKDVDPADRVLLMDGATFYWSIFQEVRLGSQRVLMDLRFRRLPRWEQTEIDEVKRRAAERAKRFGIEINATSTD